jgi:hypothetical protein
VYAFGDGYQGCIFISPGFRGHMRKKIIDTLVRMVADVYTLFIGR